GNNAVWGLDADFEESDLLVNTIGSESGRRLLLEELIGLSVEVNSGWEFTISPLSTVTPVSEASDFNLRVLDTTGTFAGAETEAISGNAPDALVLRTDQRVATVEASGSGNIAIWVYSMAGIRELLVN